MPEGAPGATQIVVILLAAGASRRFGARKMLHLLDGEALVLRTAEALRSPARRLLAVVPAEDALPEGILKALREKSVQIVQATDAALGMGHSLSAGVCAVPDALGWVIALADMPWVKSDTVAQISAALSKGASVVVPRHQGERGHPVGFAQRHYTALSALSGDTGARELLRAHRDEIVFIDVNDPGILKDIDTPADLAHANIPGNVPTSTP